MVYFIKVKKKYFFKLCNICIWYLTYSAKNNYFLYRYLNKVKYSLVDFRNRYIFTVQYCYCFSLCLLEHWWAGSVRRHVNRPRVRRQLSHNMWLWVKFASVPRPAPHLRFISDPSSRLNRLDSSVAPRYNNHNTADLQLSLAVAGHPD